MLGHRLPHTSNASLQHFQRAPGSDRNAVLLAMLGDPTTSDALIRGLATWFAPTAPGGPEVARAILERYYEEPGNWGVEPVWHVFTAMASSAEIRDDALLARAVHHEVWWQPAIYAIGEYRGVPWPSIPEMVRLHGTVNALGYGLLGTWAWTLEDRSG